LVPGSYIRNLGVHESVHAQLHQRYIGTGHVHGRQVQRWPLSGAPGINIQSKPQAGTT